MKLVVMIDDKLEHIQHIGQHTDITLKIRDGVLIRVKEGTSKKPQKVL